MTEQSHVNPFADPAAQQDPTPPEPVNPEVQAQRDKEQRAGEEQLQREEEAQRIRQEREDRAAEELSQDDRIKVALNQRVEPRDEAVFLASTGHNTAEDES